MRNLLLIILIFTAFTLFSQPQIIQYDDARGKQGFSLQSESSFGVNVNYSIEQFILSQEDIDGEMLHTISLPGNFLPNDEGMPDLPGGGRFIALPQGARAELNIVNYRVESLQNIELAPAFRIPLDTEDGPLEYNRNRAIYDQDAFYPANPIQLGEQTNIRGVDAVMLGITPFQYNPVTRELIVYRDIELEVNFTGGNGQFGVESLRSRWWDPILSDVFMNYASLPRMDYSSRNGTREGAEYLIISPDDPVFLTWADSIRVFRNEQGISTTIKTTTEIGGNSPTAIENYIDSIMDPATGWDPAPAAILLLGDYGTTGNTVVSPIYNSYCVSDNIYADVNGNSMPDVILARMTAQNETNLQTMITKFLDHERNPPTNPTFYHEPITALGWQTERWFQICSETVGGFWSNVQGKTPSRINEVYSGNPNNDPWSTATNTATVLNYFGVNGLGYIPASPSALGGWTGGNATMINNKINNGCFMLMHRDHGMETGWGEPYYTNTNINGLTNADLVFVLSINCLTGKYNWSSECFTEKFHRYTYNGQNSGALGVIAASEISYSFVNDTYVWGMIDNFWPDFMPDVNTNPIPRGILPAFGNAAGKYFLQQSNWPYNTNNKAVTYNLFHHHGDAFSVVYSEIPQNLTVIHNPVLLGGLDSFTVNADAESFIALTVDNEIIGTAEGTGMPLSISIAPQLPGDEMLVTITKQNYYRYTAIVPVIPPSGPYVVFNDLTIDDSAGNSNGIVEYSENILLSLDLENIGSDDATNVNAVISSDDDHITITDDNENYGTINSGQIITVTDGFAFTVNDNVPDLHNVLFELNATDGTDIWTSFFTITLHAPVLEIGEMMIDDSSGNNDGVLDPGETVTITIPVLNDGSADSPEAFATLICPAVGIDVQVETINLGVIGSELQVDAVFTVTAQATVPFGSPIVFYFSVEAGGFLETEEFPTQCGIFVENFENGHFNDFPWEFQGYEISFPNVNPIEDFTIIGPIDDVDWSINYDEYHSGTASAKSYPITHNQASFMSLTLDVTQDGEISFWYKVACEYSPSQTYFYDGLIFRIDDETMDYFQPDASGQSPWTFASYPVETGTHTFDWVYVKDGSDGSTFIDDDCAWVDYITFPSIMPSATGTITGSIDLIPLADFEDVEISVGNMTVNPDETGLFTLEIPVGIYNVTASLTGYETITQENVEVLEGQVTPIYFELYYLQAPENLAVVNEDETVELSWEHNQPTENSARSKSNRELQSFKIYRNQDSGNYEVIASTSELSYQDMLEEAGEYGYYVTALYDQENESDPSNTEVIIWDGTGSDDPLIPLVDALYQNSPNPFNPETKINFSTTESTEITEIAIYNLKGQKIRTLINEVLPTGHHTAIWNGRDENSKPVSSGIYFYKMRAGNRYTSTRKMILLK